MRNLFFALALFTATAAFGGTFTTYEALEYAQPAGSGPLLLDLWVPAGASLEGLELGNAQFSSRVKVVVDFYGPTDLLRIEEDKLPCIPLDGNAAYMPPSLLMGCPIQECQEKTRTASPMSYVTPDDPTFLIMHGMLDCLVPYTQSVALHEKLEDAGVDSRLILIPAGDHGGKAFDSEKYQKIVDDFLDTHLRGPVTPAPRKRRAVR